MMRSRIAATLVTLMILWQVAAHKAYGQSTQPSAGPTTQSSASPTTQSISADNDEENDWNSAKQKGDILAYLKYYRAHPNSNHIKVVTGTVKVTFGASGDANGDLTYFAAINVDGADVGLDLTMFGATSMGIIDNSELRLGSLPGAKTFPNARIIRSKDGDKLLTIDVTDVRDFNGERSGAATTRP